MANENEQTQVANIPQGEVVMPDFVNAGDMGMGFGNADKDAYAIPFLQILQKMSPQVDDNNPKYVEGAKPGMFFNSVTQKLFDSKEGLQIIQCFYRRSFILWAPRDEGGGFKGEFEVDDIEKLVSEQKVVNVNGRLLVKDAKGEIDVKKSDYYADTRSHYIIIIDPETGELSQAILSLSATQTKASRTLMTLLQQRKVNTPQGKRTAPTFANIIRFTTIPMSNEKGSWSGAKFAIEAFVTDKDVYSAALEFYKAIHSGDVRADYSKTQDGEESAPEQKEADNF